MEKNKVKLSDLEESDRIKEIKEMYGDTESFLMKANPKTQVDFCDLRMAISCDCPTIDDLCLTYGKTTVLNWLCVQLIDLTLYANCNSLPKAVCEELSRVILVNCQEKLVKVSEMLHFFYTIKSGQDIWPDWKISPISIMFHLHKFFARRNAILWFNERENLKKVFLIVDDQPKAKVYARIFGTKIKAEKALKERDERTGERLYSNCHIIERTIE
jgi:hypothetical protein